MDRVDERRFAQMETMKWLARDRFLRFAAMTLSSHEEGVISLIDAARLIESHGDGMVEAFGAVEKFELIKVVDETRADIKLFIEAKHGAYDSQWLMMNERTVGTFQQLMSELPKFKNLRFRRIQGLIEGYAI
jgi:hypothetical protein